MRTPPLVTSGTNPPATLFGNSRTNNGIRPGLRTEFGVWMCDCAFAIQGGYFLLGPGQSFGQYGSAQPNQTIGRPFVDPNTGQVVFEQVVNPGTLAGFATVSSSTTFSGANALLRCPLCCQSCCDDLFRLDLLGGYRYFSLNDQLDIRENLMPTAAPFVPGTRISVLDSFRTQNVFHGASIGAAVLKQRGTCFAQVIGMVDFGAMNRTVTIAGATQTVVPGMAPVTRPGGLLAQSSNIGTYRSSSFTVIPELDMRLGCNVTKSLSLTVGYTFLLITDVARAAEQIDLAVNPNLLPGAPNSGVGPARPAYVQRLSNAWVQGVSVGACFTW